MAKVQELSALNAQSASLEDTVRVVATDRPPWRNRDVRRHMRKAHADVEEGVVRKAIARVGGNKSLVTAIFALTMSGIAFGFINIVISVPPVTPDERLAALIVAFVAVIFGVVFAMAASQVIMKMIGVKYEWQEVVLDKRAEPVPYKLLHFNAVIHLPDFVRDAVSEIRKFRPDATFLISYLADDPVLWVCEGKERVAALVWKDDRIINAPRRLTMRKSIVRFYRWYDQLDENKRFLILAVYLVVCAILVSLANTRYPYLAFIGLLGFVVGFATRAWYLNHSTRIPG